MRRAISIEYCDPKSMTTTASGDARRVATELGVAVLLRRRNAALSSAVRAGSEVCCSGIAYPVGTWSAVVEV